MVSVPRAEVSFTDSIGRKKGILIIVPTGKGQLFKLEPKEVREISEELVQLVEGQRYEYEFNGYPGLRVRSSDVVKPSSLADLQERSGLIEPGNNTGLLRLVLEDANGTDIATAFAEVRSEKLSYREDYRRMLDFIADKSIDLISYIHGSLQTRLVPDPGHDPNTIQNRLAFVRSLISSDQFSEALERIIVMPHRAWQVAETKTDISKSRKLSRKALDQVFHSNPRTHLPNDLPLARRMHLLGYEDPSISRYVIIDQRKETTDTAENRFVKYILEDFLDFVLKAKKRLADMSRPTAEVAFRELRRLSDDLEGYLDRDFFKEISKPNILPLGSQVMQRKSGYREVFEAWIKFQYAAKLTWEGGDSVFGAGKRDLPTLYEYWAFFQLYELLSNLFSFKKESLRNLLERTEDGFSLKLKSGRLVLLKGQYQERYRNLNLEFSYNRTFSPDRYPRGGSWTLKMRPDYTLSIWPEPFDAPEAERQELMVHLHFDAKYRIEKLQDAFESEDEEDSQNNHTLQSEVGKAKRADLNKMHAYKDAIRRTEGAYILYPGSEKYSRQQYHELLPGLGAFPLRPGHEKEDIRQLRLFLHDVLENLCDRASRRELHSYHAYSAQHGPNVCRLSIPVPEQSQDGKRTPPPDEHFVMAVPVDHPGIKRKTE